MIIIEFEIPEDITLSEMRNIQDIMKDRYDYNLETNVTFNLRESTVSFHIETEELVASEFHLIESIMNSRECNLKKIHTKN